MPQLRRTTTWVGAALGDASVQPARRGGAELAHGWRTVVRPANRAARTSSHPHDRDVGRYGQARLLGSEMHAEGDLVVGADDRVRDVVQ